MEEGVGGGYRDRHGDGDPSWHQWDVHEAALHSQWSDAVAHTHREFWEKLGMIGN